MHFFPRPVARPGNTQTKEGTPEASQELCPCVALWTSAILRPVRSPALKKRQTESFGLCLEGLGIVASCSWLVPVLHAFARVRDSLTGLNLVICGSAKRIV